METKIDVEHGKKNAKKWGDNICEGIPSLGLSGGLLLLWDETVDVRIITINKNVVNAYITDRHHNKF